MTFPFLKRERDNQRTARHTMLCGSFFLLVAETVLFGFRESRKYKIQQK